MPVVVEWNKITGGGNLEPDGWFVAGERSGITCIRAKDKASAKLSQMVKVTVKGKDDVLARLEIIPSEAKLK